MRTCCYDCCIDISNIDCTGADVKQIQNAAAAIRGHGGAPSDRTGAQYPSVSHPILGCCVGRRKTIRLFPAAKAVDDLADRVELEVGVFQAKLLYGLVGRHFAFAE